MTTLFTHTLELSRILQRTIDRAATAGNATTLTDGSISGFYPNDHWNGGTIWMRSGLNVGKSRLITDYTSAGVFTFPTMTSLNAAADLYSAAGADFPQWMLIQAINRALQEIAPSLVNIATVTVSMQEEYTLPAGVYNLKQVRIANELTAPYDFAKHFHWHERDGKLLFDTQLAPIQDGYIIELTYVPIPAELTADTSEPSKTVNMQPLIWRAAVHALRSRISETGDDEPAKIRQLNEALANAERMTSMHPTKNVEPTPHFAPW
jgi:hypothetical protein